MGSGVVTNNGKNWLLNRAYKGTSDYEEAFYLKVGIGLTAPNVVDTGLEFPIPILNGTVNDDGSNTFTGSSGGDNSTDNIVRFKDGCNVVDVTAQNLIKNDTNATAIWTIADLSSAGTIITDSQYVSLWFYVLDSVALAKLVSSGTCLEVKLGSDSSNYYSITKTASDLVVGWNWVHSFPDTVADLTETGTVTGDIDTFIIEVTTNNATDEFTATTDATADIVYDLLRTYEDSDMLLAFESGYPSFSTVDKTVTVRGKISVIYANGFDISEIGCFTKDGTPIMITHDVFTGESKGPTDEFAFNITDEVD